MRRLVKIWKNTTISKAAKVKVYETMVLSILCYNSGDLDIDSRDERTVEMCCLRWIMDVSRRDHIKNEDIRAHLGITEDIVERIQERRLRYFGHVVRMDNRLSPT